MKQFDDVGQFLIILLFSIITVFLLVQVLGQETINILILSFFLAHLVLSFIEE